MFNNNFSRFNQIVMFAALGAALASTPTCLLAGQPVRWYTKAHHWVGPGGIAPWHQKGKSFHFQGRDDYGQRATLSFVLNPNNQIKNGKFEAIKDCQPGLALAGARYSFEGPATSTCSFSGFDYPCGNIQPVPIQGTITLRYGQFHYGGRGITAILTGKGSTRYWYFATNSNPFNQ